MLQLKVFVIILMVILIDSAPIKDGNEATDAHPANSNAVTLLKYINEPYTADTPEYKFEYETSDGQTREEIGKFVKNKEGVEYLLVRGSYSYTGPDDVVYTVFYTADEDGFQATGDHIPGKGEEVPVVQLDRNVVISLLG